MKFRAVVLFVLLISAATPAAFAQSGGTFAIGGAFTVRVPVDSEVNTSKGPGLTWRWGHAHTGFGWHWGLNWFTTEVDRAVGDSDVELGELRVRPFMAGYGYTRVFGRTSVTADVLAGYAFTSMSVTREAGDAYRDRLGARSLTVDTTNTATAMPEAGVWFDLSRKVGINFNAGYVVARPRLTVRSTLGEDSRKIRADMFLLKIAAVYSIF
jgi:hypothetical protein